jgi:hypothetical protein
MDCNQKYPFSFDLGIIPSLFYLTKTCRHKATRIEEISILKSSPRRETFWNSLLIADISEWLMMKEETGRVGNFIPESARLRVTGININMLERTVKVNWIGKTSEGDDMSIENEAIIKQSRKWTA